MPRRGESVYKRKDGRWEARYIHHYENGKAKYRFLYAATYAEVKAKRFAEQSLPQNTMPSSIKSTVNFKELALLWLQDVQIAVKESTYTRYYRSVYCYLMPRLGERLPVKMDSQIINRVTQELLREGGKNNTPLSPKTVTDILCVLKAILRYGRAHGYPCVTTDLIQSPAKSRKAAVALPCECRTAIEEQLFGAEDPVSLGILFTLYTGVRIGELCGLRWGDFDWDHGTVTIRRTVERIADLSVNAPQKTKVIVSEPKTEHAVRVIPLTSFLITHLKKHVPNNDCYLLTGTQKPTEPHQYYMRYKTFMRRIGKDEYTFHALRHTFATRCIENGFDTKSLSEILGHANVTTTLAIYVHPTLEQKRAQMERLTPQIDL